MKPSHVLLFCGLIGSVVIAGVLSRRLEQPIPFRLPEQRGPPFRVAPPTRVWRPPAASEAPRVKREAPRERRLPVGKGPKVQHQPEQPRSGQAVLITADVKSLSNAPTQLALEYQIVEPGKYISLQDSRFAKDWATMPMRRNGETDAQSIGQNVFSAELPLHLQKHRRLVRYRIRSGDDGKIIAPPEGDAQPNFAYFVYDGVPAWKGAINPNGGDSRLRQSVVYSPEALQRVPVYHLIGSKSAVENATWGEPGQFGGRERNEYKYTGTIVYDGIVYDHVGFRARGGGWRHAMGKNMWKFNFLPGHRFAARDYYGNRYQSKWDKLNLGACIQQGDYGMRGEQGMFEAVGFRLFNLAGMEASRTHWVHLRIIDEAEESPANQYAGDFWGLYLAVENVDEHFLREHDLPAGNLYKIEGGAKTAFNGDPAITDQSDVRAFFRASRQRSDGWWPENVDLGRYYDYRAIVECIHHYDIEGGKNYFYYLNPQSRKWVVIPWDIDLTWGDQMFGGGHDPFYQTGLLSRPPFKQQYQERLAEIRDLLFNAEQLGLLIDEHATMISDPNGSPSLVEADRAKWDYHPVLASPYVIQMKAGQGRFYFGNARNTFESMVKYMKAYGVKRAKWIDSHLLSDYNPPPAPRIATPAQFDYSAENLPFQLNSKAEDSFQNYRWRLAEVTDPKSRTFNSHEPWKYEIQALWQQEIKGATVASIPTALLSRGRTYRVRVRGEDSSGTWTRWSPPVQFTVK